MMKRVRRAVLLAALLLNAGGCIVIPLGEDAWTDGGRYERDIHEPVDRPTDMRRRHQNDLGFDFGC